MKYVKIKKIEKVDGKPIYHLSVKKNRNFFGNNLLLHNCDYYSNISNDGNIGICLINLSNNVIKIEDGERIAQGIFMNFLVSDNCNSDESRIGGIGSTNK
jgi:dUTP pyrophosphatase